jgi:aldehyde dehydrogenase (NAD+)
MSDIQNLFDSQTAHRWNQSQTTADERIAKLRRLKEALRGREAEFKAAMWDDLRKPAIEVEFTELFPVIEEINTLIHNLKKWMKPKRAWTPLILFGNRSEVYSEARGLVLVMAPWNYPLLLLMTPVASAYGAGNCVIAKPSEKTPKTSALIREILSAIFSPNEIGVVEGGPEVSQALTELPFDHICFTGSTRVGRMVMLAAARNLATVTLELGGKSPTIVLPDADLKDAVEKIAWGRFLNGGQSCVAPDHVYVHESLRTPFIESFKNYTQATYQSKDLSRIIDAPAFSRIQTLFNESQFRGEKVITGGQFNPSELSISPTAVEAKADSPLMSEEIFGPILPVIFYQDLDTLLSTIQKQPKPLALYVFGKKDCDKVLRQTTSGAALVNNVVIHFGNPATPLGGVGASGQGRYHGYYGFCTFSHQKTVMKLGVLNLVPMLFPPYNRPAVRLARWFAKLISK